MGCEVHPDFFMPDIDKDQKIVYIIGIESTEESNKVCNEKRKKSGMSVQNNPVVQGREQSPIILIRKKCNIGKDGKTCSN